MIVQATAAAIPLADGTVQCCVTSPPYFGLRSYETPPQVWPGDAPQGGDAPLCEGGAHEWEVFTRKGQSGGTAHAFRYVAVAQIISDRAQAFCRRCGAWRGELGQEPTPELYIAHLVRVFREVRRVLRDDGVMFVNIGDSYGSG